jgi:hypothetical protein
MADPTPGDVHVPGPLGGSGTRPRRLLNLLVKEISAVDAPANRRAWLVVKGTERVLPAESRASFATQLRTGLQVLAERLGWGEAELAKADAAVEAPSFSQALLARQLDDLRDELLDHLGALQETLWRVVAGEGADKPAAIRQAVGDFSTALEGLVGRWLAGDVSKVGRKVSADRLARLARMRDLLDTILQEGGPTMADDKDKATKGAEAPVVKAEEFEALRKRLGELEAKDQAHETALQKVVAEAELAKQQAVAMQTEIERRDAMAKARSFAHLPINPDDDAGTFQVLARMGRGEAGGEAEALKKAATRLTQLLTAADELIRKAGSGSPFVERGSSQPGAGTGTALAKAEGLAREKVQKDGKLAPAAAMAQVWTEHPDLYQQYLTENPKQTA